MVVKNYAEFLTSIGNELEYIKNIADKVEDDVTPIFIDYEIFAKDVDVSANNVIANYNKDTKAILDEVRLKKYLNVSTMIKKFFMSLVSRKN